MAKNDYFVLLYQILSYLYRKFKDGKKADQEEISAEALNIPVGYWENIIESMALEGYIRGVVVRTNYDGDVFLIFEGGPKITEKGIDFLQNNSRMSRVKDALKDIKEIIPGI